MGILTTEGFEKMGLNTYEAVILASQHARRLNIKRLAQLELLEEDPTLDIESRKIPLLALRDLLDGKLKYKLSDSM